MNGHDRIWRSCPCCDAGNHAECLATFGSGPNVVECDCPCGRPDPYDLEGGGMTEQQLAELPDEPF